MKLTNEQKLDLISSIDEEIIDRNTEKRAELLMALAIRTRLLGSILMRRVIAAGAVAAMLIISLVAVFMLRPDDDGTEIVPAATLELVSSDGESDTYRIKYADGRASYFTVTGAEDGIEEVKLNSQAEILLGFVGGAELNIGSSVGKMDKGDTSDTSITEISMDEGELTVTLASEEKVGLGKPHKPVGPDGAYMTEAKINAEGELEIGFSSGEHLNLGRVVGRDGEDGVGISGIVINDAGELVITLSDGTVVNLGDVRGVGIESTAINDAGELIITYTDGKVANLGKVVGADGVGIKTLTLSSDGYLTVMLTDGTVHELGCVKGDDGKSAYELYCEAYGYEGTEEQWLYDLVNGNLAERVYFTVAFDSQGGSAVPSQSVERGMKARTPTDPVRAGYEFIGWFVGDEKWSFLGYSVTDNVTLTAHWRTVTYTLNYTVGDGTLEGEAPVEYTVLDTLEIPNAALGAHDFLGWTYEGLDTPKKDLTIPVGTYGNLNLVAHFRLKDLEYTVPVSGSILQGYSDTHKGIDVGAAVGGTVLSANSGYVTRVSQEDGRYTVDIELPSGKATLVYSNLGSCELRVGDAVICGAPIGLISDGGECEDGGYVHIGVRVGDVLVDPATVFPEHIIAAMDLGGFGFLENSDGTLTINSYFGTGGTVVIPGEYDGKTVKQIANGSFKNNTSITSLIIGEGVRIIQNDAFYGCSALTSIYISSTVDQITPRAFGACEALRSIRVAESNPIYRSEGECLIEDEVLILGCASSVIPSGVKVIGPYAFFKCSWLGAIEIPEGVERIMANAFAHCTGAYSISLPSTLVYIGQMAFQTSTRLSEVIIPASVTEIASNAFQGCKRIEFLSVEQGNAVYYSEGNCIIMRNDHTLVIGCKNSVIPSEVLSIGEYAFYNQTELSRINIPDSVTSIKKSAFEGCVALSTVIFSGTSAELKAITEEQGNSLFLAVTPVKCVAGNTAEEDFVYQTCMADGHYYRVTYCSDCGEVMHKEKIILKKSEKHNTENGECIWCGAPRSTAGLEFETSEDGKGYILVGIGECTASEIIIGTHLDADVVAIADGAFAGQDGVERVVIKAKELVIGKNAFADCKSLYRVIIQNGVSEIGDGAFSGCESMRLAFVPKCVQRLGHGIFDVHSSRIVPLTIAYGGDDITEIFVDEQSDGDNYKFVTNAVCDSACGLIYSTDGVIYGLVRSLESIVIPSYLKYRLVNTIADSAFENERTLVRVVIPKELISIGNRAFYGCTMLEEADLPDTLHTVGDYAFGECSKLRTAEIPHFITYVGKGAFYRCSGLVSVSYKSMDTVLEDSTFEGCSSLSAVYLPEDMEKICDRVFYGCTSLSKITIPSDVSVIGDGAFAYCAALESVTLGKYMQSIGIGAFEGCSALREAKIQSSKIEIADEGGLFFGCSVLSDVYLAGGEIAWQDRPLYLKLIEAEIRVHFI